MKASTIIKELILKSTIFKMDIFETNLSLQKFFQCIKCQRFSVLVLIDTLQNFKWRGFLVNADTALTEFWTIMCT